ncbi:hypothetical protein [Thermophilibacter provencensis]|uniref:hypothetical protein n=1 Tax=Thermophilibacter provencensis TaxID=1852386 RepID=UPI002355B1FC|nr:hypothetical protein [Thermophilibacter provencensis]
MRGTEAWPAVLGIVAGALALFGTVGIVGVELPLATMPLSAGRLADALLTASESLRSMPLVEERASEIVTFLQSATGGRLATLLWTLCTGHVLACGAAITLAALDLRGAHRAWRPVVAGALVVADAAVVSVLCSAMSWQLYLVVRSVARGNPWAVGRGVAGLELTLTPGLGLVVAALLGVCAIALALVGRRGASVAAAS